MAPNIVDAPQNADSNPGQKTLHVWSKSIEQPDGQGQSEANSHNARPTISEAVSMIKADDFTNVHNTPCARQGFLTGIAAGAGVGALKFVLKGACAVPADVSIFANKLS